VVLNFKIFLTLVNFFSGNHFGGYGSGGGGSGWTQGGPQGWNNVWGSQASQGGWGNGGIFITYNIYKLYIFN